MARFTDLPRELKDRIGSFITSKTDLASLSLASKNVYPSAARKLWRHVTIDVREVGKKSLSALVSTENDHQDFVRRVSIPSMPRLFDSQCDPVELERLLNVFLQALSANQLRRFCSLFVLSPSTLFRLMGTQQQMEVISIKLLRTREMRASVCQQPQALPILPKLEHLTISEMVCMDNQSPIQEQQALASYLPMLLEAMPKLNNLHVGDLSTVPALVSPKPVQLIRLQLQLRMKNIYAPALQCVELGMLQELVLSECSSTTSILDELTTIFANVSKPALKKFSLIEKRFRLASQLRPDVLPSLTGFLASFSGLEEIQIRIEGQALPWQSLGSHGSTLKKLYLDGSTQEQIRIPIRYTHQDLDWIAQTCPNIKQLAFETPFLRPASDQKKTVPGAAGPTPEFEELIRVVSRFENLHAFRILTRPTGQIPRLRQQISSFAWHADALLSRYGSYVRAFGVAATNEDDFQYWFLRKMPIAGIRKLRDWRREVPEATIFDDKAVGEPEWF